MKKFKKLCVLLLSLILISAVLAGCGAKITTDITVDKNFSGQRKIDAKISNEDLSKYVTGGIDALKSVADANIPQQMTCSVSSDDSGSVITFVIAFDNIDDYREKVKAIIDTGINKDLKPEIDYENFDTVFKKGVKFKENFTSFDLLQWYFDALNESKIITYESTSNWYELGGGILHIDEEEYDSGSKMSVSEQENCCLEKIDVETTVKADGSFERIFNFHASDSTVEKLSERDCNLSSYFSELKQEGDLFEEKDDGSDNKYIITVKAENAEELVDKTNQILKTDNAFSVDITLDEDNIGMAKVSVQEKLDGSYYLNYDYSNKLTSTVNLFDNVSFAKDEEYDAQLSKDVLQYNPSQTETSTFNFDWKISFDKVEMITKINSKKRAVVNFVFTSEESLSDELKESAIDALKQFCGESGKFSENSNGCKISFSGSIEKITEQINEMLHSDDSEIDGNEYFEIDYTKNETASRFTNGYSGTIIYNLSPLIGNTRILFNDKTGLFSEYYYHGGLGIDSEGNKTASSNGSIEFTIVKISPITLALAFVFAVCLTAGLIMLVLQRKALSEFVKSLTVKKTKTVKPSQNDISHNLISTATEENPNKADADEKVATTVDSACSNEEETEEIL